ncbi:MAG: TonB-dependent receptor [Candidatus Solibacter usitatus]|nr:TonB-dependent receptor [Candidatus Solibacter usitatus]
MYLCAARFVCLLVLTGLSIATAQTFTANITGVISDPTGAAIPGVKVRLENAATRESRETSAGSEGRYTFSQLQPGVYELKAEVTGFKSFAEKGITLLSGQSASVNVAMQVGEISQRVEIASSAVQVDTQTANQAVSLDREMVLALPTNLRNPFTLVHATAGVTAPATGISQSVADQNQDRFGLNGGRSTTTGVLLDGVNASAGNSWNGLLISPAIDSVAEVQVIRNAYDSQYGRSGGGMVSVVTKGGGADFHGTAFDFLRNSKLDANSWSNNRNGLPRTLFQRNQVGGNFSGPIWKSKKIYFFGGYEGLRQGSPTTSVISLPTPLERSGDFSQTFNSNGTLSAIYNPFSTRPNPNGAGFLRDAFAGNRIPSSLMDPVGVKTVALYPDATSAGDPFTHSRNYSAAGKGKTVSDRSDIRFDWARSEKHQMYGRLSRAWRQAGLPAANVFQSLTGTGNISGNPRYQMSIGNTFVPNPTWVINIMAAFGSWTERQSSPFAGRDGRELGLPASFVSLLDVKTLPQITMENYSNMFYSRDLNNISRVANIQANATKEMGAHSFKFGFTRDGAMLTGGGLFSADFSFSRGMTSGPNALTSSTTSGNAVASLLLGTGSGGNVQKPALGAVTRLYYGWYFQDTWRIHRRITINPGVRYELHRPATERFNRFSNFNYAVENPLSKQTGLALKGGLTFVDANNRFSWDPLHNNFAPRLGISFKLKEKLVLRTGYGIFFPTQTGTGDLTGYSSTTPWTFSQGGDGINPQDLYRNPYPNGLIPAVGNSGGLLTNIGRGAGGYDRNHRNGYMQNFSADFQYDFGRNTVLEFGYAGHQGRKLVYGVSLNDNQLPTSLLSMGTALDTRVNNPFFGLITGGNLAAAQLPRHRFLRPFPEFDTVTRNSQTPGGSSSYNAMLLKLSKQFSSGLMLLTSYQWSKAIDNIGETEPSPGGAADGFRDSSNFRIERSLGAHDLPHSMVTAIVYALPFGRGKHFGGGMNRAVDFVAGGWQISSIMRLSSGLPVRLTANSTISQYGFGTQYPNVTRGEDVAVSSRVPERWFNTSAFSAPAAYTIGNSPRRLDQLRASHQKNADISVAKNFRVRELLRVQFRAEAFNLTNTPQFSWPDTQFGSNTFGVVSGTMNVGPRNVQFGLKVDF